MANEKRLISAKELERQIKEAFKDNPYAMGQMLRWIRKQPTVDAVEVVRCLDYKYSEPCKPHNKIWCPRIVRYLNADFYCAEGAKKE